MTLKLSSKYPRLDHCGAFDVSPLSDYPEEQEYLVGFMYTRVEEIITDELFGNGATYLEIIQKTPIGSLMREEFLAIHLFKEQMFSMTGSLVKSLALYLRVNRKECCENASIYKKCRDGDYWDEQMKLICACVHGAKHKQLDDGYHKLKGALANNRKKMDDLDRMKKVREILWGKFTAFRTQKSVTFDCVSDILKTFFMEFGDDFDVKTGNRKWAISFENIVTVYPNIRELHFMNQYRFDGEPLQRLIAQIRKKENTLEKVTFSYYDYRDTNDLDEPICDAFVNPAALNAHLLQHLEKLNWKIKKGNIANAGYKITISYNKTYKSD